MISAALKPAVTRVIAPIAKGFLAMGLTPNAITVLGATGVVTSSLYFYPQGELLKGTLIIAGFALSDLFDGTMARISQAGASKWGGFLDSTLDRITDGAILIGLILWLEDKNSSTSYVAFVALVTGVLIPYIRAKAEALSIECTVGIAERTERVVLALVAIGFEGLGVPYVLDLTMILLAVLGVITVLQRINVVRKALT